MIELRRILAQYAYGSIDRRGLEDWIVSNLQAVLDSRDEEAIEIVNELDGKISVVSTVGRGTTFSLEFARVEGRPVVPAATAAAS